MFDTNDTNCEGPKVHRGEVQGRQAAFEAGSQAVGVDAAAAHYVFCGNAPILAALDHQIVRDVILNVSCLCAAPAHNKDKSQPAG